MGRSGIILAIVLIGCYIFTISIAREEDNMLGSVIGIDLGTTSSCVSVYNNGHYEIIPNDLGNRTTPSWVAFTDSFERPLVGDAAKDHADENPERTIFNVKRLIGRKFEDEDVQRAMKDVPYKIVDKDGKPYIQVEFKDGETEVFSPEEISAMILSKMKETADTFIGKKLTNVLVTIPVYFNDAQREATKDACVIAGWSNVMVVNEPIAAACAYGLHKVAAEKNILVFDLDNGKFDVSILEIEYGVIAVSADTHLEGDDFHQKIMEYSSEPLTQAQFEELNDLFMGPVKKVMEDAGLGKHQIDEIILVGGSTKIQLVQQLLKDYFDGKIEPMMSVDPDEVVAIGAATIGDVLIQEEEMC